MKKFTKSLAILLSLIMCFGVLPLAASAANIASGGFGSYGSGSWVIDANGNLTISGEFGIKYTYKGAPWYEYKDSIKAASFVPGSYAKKGESLSYMFNDCVSLASLDLSNLDTSSVTYMCYMFYNCTSLTSLDLSNFDTSSVTDMTGMFYNCSSLTSLDLSNFDTSSVADMSTMFYNCSSLTSLDLSSFNTSSVTDLDSMFTGCKSLTSLDVSNFDTSSVKYMGDMFSNCSSLTSLDLSSFDTSSVTNMSTMFKNCGKSTNGLPAKGIVFDADEAAKFNNSSITGINANQLVFSVDTKIKNIKITGITPPFIGETASFDYEIPSNCKYEISTAYWAETEGRPNSLYSISRNSVKYYEGDNLKFEAGKYYSFVVNVRPLSGFEFDNTVSATINNISSGTETREGYIGIWRCFGKPTYKNIKITGVTPPVAGEQMSFSFNIPSDEGYILDTPNHAVWVESDSVPSMSNLTNYIAYPVDDADESFIFKPDKYYTFCVYVKEDVGYEFPEIFFAEINGNDAEIIKGNNFSSISYCFGKTAAAQTKTLSSISVTTQPTKKTYNAGENFNKSGMVVKANYSDSTSATITSYTVTNGNNLTAGQTSVTISYTEGGVTKTATVAITVTGNISDPTPTIAIKNNPGTKTINYGEGVKFTAITTNLPAGAQIKWYVNGVEKGTGTTFTFSDATVTAKVVDNNGNVMKDASNGEISASEKITVKAGFFQKLISFFKNLFKANRIIEQGFESDK